MIKYLLFITLLVFGHPFLNYAQKHDHIWMFGYGGSTGNPLFGITKLDFNNPNNPPVQEDPDALFYFDATDVSMCDSEGTSCFIPMA